MSLKSGQSITVDFCTQNTSGAATNADSTPTGTLVVNGTDDGATVTVTNKSTGNYKAAVTLPSLTAGDVVQIRISATIGGTAAKAVIFQGVADTERVSDLNDLSTAQVNAEVDTALADYDGPTNAEMEARTLVAASYSTLTAQQVWEYATRTLTAISDSAGITTLLSRIVGTLAAGTHNAQSGDAYARLGAPAGASVSADVAALSSDLGTLQSTVEGVDANIGAAGAGLTALASAADLATVDTVVDAIQAKTDNLPAAPAATSDIPTAAAVADAVWDEAIADHQAAGSTGEALDGAGGSAAPTAGEVADAVWDEALAGHVGAGTAGKSLADAGTAGDPWSTALPGAYAAGTAGHMLDAIKDKTDAIGSQEVTFTTPVAATGDATIYAGQSHTDALALGWTITDWSGPSLAGNSAVLRIKRAGKYAAPLNRAADLEFAATVAQDGTTVTAAVSLTSAQTATIPLGRHRAQIVADVAGEEVIVRDIDLTVRELLDAPA